MAWYDRCSDEFVRTAALDGSTLDNQYPDGYATDTWSVVSGTWDTASGAARETAGGSVHYARIGSAPDVQECRFSTIFGAGDSGIVICCNSDGSANYMAYYDGTKIYLYRSGVDTGSPVNISSTDLIRIWTEVSGANLIVRIDQNGTNVIGYTDTSPLAAGKPGLRGGGGGGNWTKVLYEVLTPAPGGRAWVGFLFRRR